MAQFAHSSRFLYYKSTSHKALPFITVAAALCAAACSHLQVHSPKPDTSSAGSPVPTHITIPTNIQKPTNSFYISGSHVSEFPGSVGEPVIKVTSNDVSLIFTKNTQTVVQVIINGVASGPFTQLVAERSQAGAYIETPMRTNDGFERDVQRALNLSPKLAQFFIGSHLQVYKPPQTTQAPQPN